MQKYPILSEFIGCKGNIVAIRTHLNLVINPLLIRFFEDHARCRQLSFCPAFIILVKVIRHPVIRQFLDLKAEDIKKATVRILVDPGKVDDVRNDRFPVCLCNIFPEGMPGMHGIISGEPVEPFKFTGHDTVFHLVLNFKIPVPR